MIKKRFTAALTAVVICMGLAGCGKNEIPDMTDEQTKAVGEYVAITMMKYDANHRSRLVDLAKFPEKPETPAATPIPSPEPSGEPSGMGPVDNTPVIDSAGNNSQSLEEVLGLPEGMRLAYSGQEICSSYLDTLSLKAAAGQKLLVLKYMLVNTGDQDREIDILSGSASFRITVNGKYVRNALKSGLPSDLSTFYSTIQGNTSVETALLIEVNEETASDISSISLKVKNGEKTYTVQIL